MFNHKSPFSIDIWKMYLVPTYLSELLCAGLCDTMFTVSGTLIWAVLTSQTDWVFNIGTLTLCVEAVAWSCIIVTWWSGSGKIQA